MAAQEEFKVEVSAHHCHLTQETVDGLFGPGFNLDAHIRKPLSQPGQYASDIRVDVEVVSKDGKKRRLKNVSILGPVRKYNQVEISLTDAVQLKVDVPVRQSGKVAGSVPCAVIRTDPVTGADLARVELKEGVVAQKRHIHINPAQAERLGVSNNQIVSVAVDAGSDRRIIFQDVVVRVDPSFDLAMHLDTDEGNAAGVKGTAKGHIVEVR